MNARKRATKIDLTVNKLDRETFDLLSAEQISPQELWFITSADSVVVDIDKIGQGGGGGHDYGPEISELSANKRDYDDLTYGGTYDPTDAEGYYGITSWHIAGYKYNGQTLPAFDTSTRFKNNQTYGTGWNDGYTAIHTSPSNPSDFSTLYLDGFGNADPVPFTLSLDKTTYEFSFMGREQQNLTLTANLANADRLALNSQLSAYVTSAWVMNYVNDQISAALEAQV